MLTLARKIFPAKIRRVLRRKDSFLRKVTGVIHVGANIGQERDLYAEFNLDVVWIEPIPKCFEQLCSHLIGFPKQRAYRYLITDQDEQEYVFHISNNDGGSSSILPLAKHQQMWPKIVYLDTVKLTSITLSSFVKRERLDLAAFQALVLDTQGSELMILKGAKDILSGFRFAKVEVPDFESYKGCCLTNELVDFMSAQGFGELRRDALKSLPGIGTYYDILYGQSE